jgi:hypothetical protein
MIVVIGLVILFVAVMVAITGMLTNAGGTHDSFAVLGYHVTGSTGTSFLFGIMIGAVVLLSLSLLLTGARRNAGRGPDARRELKRSQREAAFLNRDHHTLAERQEVGSPAGSFARPDGGHDRPEPRTAAGLLVAPSSAGRHRRTVTVPDRSGAPRSLPGRPRSQSAITEQMKELRDEYR